MDEKRDIAKDRVMCEAATKGPWTFSRDHGCKDIKGDKQNDTPQAHYMTTVAVTPGNSPDEQDRANTRFIAESRTALPFYIDLCEHLERMVEAAVDEITRRAEEVDAFKGPCPDGGWGCDKLRQLRESRNWNLSDKVSDEEEAALCRQCWSDYFDQKAKEGVKS